MGILCNTHILLTIIYRLCLHALRSDQSWLLRFNLDVSLDNISFIIKLLILILKVVLKLLAGQARRQNSWHLLGAFPSVYLKLWLFISIVLVLNLVILLAKLRHFYIHHGCLWNLLAPQHVLAYDLLYCLDWGFLNVNCLGLLLENMLLACINLILVRSILKRIDRLLDHLVIKYLEDIFEVQMLKLLIQRILDSVYLRIE